MDLFRNLIFNSFNKIEPLTVIAFITKRLLQNYI